MGDLSGGHTFVDGELVSAATLNNMQATLEIAAGAVGTPEIADASVTAAKLSAALNLSAGQIGLTSGRILVGNGSNVGVAGTVGATLVVTSDTLNVATGGVAAAQLAADAVTTAKIADANVTLAKIANVTDARLLGRSAGSAGAPQEISVGTGLALAAGVLAVTTGGGNIRLAGWQQFTTPVTFSTNTYADSGLTLTVTPTSAASSFLVFAFLKGSALTDAETGCFRVLRNGTTIGLPTSAGASRVKGNASIGVGSNNSNSNISATIAEYDQPATASPVTYKVQGLALQNTQAFLNRGYSDADLATSFRACSSLLVIEILP